MSSQDVDVTSNPPSTPISAVARALAKFVQWAARSQLAFEVAKERHRLAQLDQTMLSDIGITADHARAESQRRFWDLKGIKKPVQS